MSDKANVLGDMHISEALPGLNLARVAVTEHPCHGGGHAAHCFVAREPNPGFGEVAAKVRFSSVQVDGGAKEALTALRGSVIEEVMALIKDTGIEGDILERLSAKSGREPAHPTEGTICAHGRPLGRLCPWCSGINALTTEEGDEG